MNITIIIIIIVVVLVVFILLLLYCFCKYFVKDRTSAVKLRIPIIYLPDKIAVEEEKVNNRTKLNPFDKKRLEFRKARDSLKLVVVVDNSHEYEEYLVKLEEAEKLKEYKNNYLRRYFYCFYGKETVINNDIESRNSTINDLVVSKVDEGIEEEEPNLDDETGPSKRFVSQDRLKRKEMRKNLLSQKSFIENKLDEFIEEDEYDNLSVLDLERLAEERTKVILADRKAKRVDKKNQAIIDGDVDVVAINSGPPIHMIPKGYTLSKIVPEITPEVLIKRKVMYLWGNDHKRVKGWYFGMISTESRKKGCNFNIKYDRAETHNIFVDGVKNVHLTLTGENAYGKRWVVLDKVVEHK